MSPASQNREVGARSLGSALREARQQAGISVRQLAPMVGVHRSFLSRIETGEYHSAKPALLQRLAKVLEVDEQDLFALAGYEAPEGLPKFSPYLRAKYQLSDNQLRDLERYFEFITSRDDREDPPAA